MGLGLSSDLCPYPCVLTWIHFLRKLDQFFKYHKDLNSVTFIILFCDIFIHLKTIIFVHLSICKASFHDAFSVY
jgi:hypothetical protein